MCCRKKKLNSEKEETKEGEKEEMTLLPREEDTRRMKYSGRRGTRLHFLRNREDSTEFKTQDCLSRVALYLSMCVEIWGEISV
jgi:hypothetical protein